MTVLPYALRGQLTLTFAGCECLLVVSSSKLTFLFCALGCMCHVIIHLFYYYTSQPYSPDNRNSYWNPKLLTVWPNWLVTSILIYTKKCILHSFFYRLQTMHLTQMFSNSFISPVVCNSLNYLWEIFINFAQLFP